MVLMEVPKDITIQPILTQTGGGVIPMLKNFDVKYVTFKGPFGSIN